MRNQLDAEIERIHTSWNTLEEVVRGLTDAEWVQVTDGKWSAQDHLMHIALAEQYVRAVLRQEPPHTLFGIDPETLLSLNDDELNEVGHRLTQSLTTTEVAVLHRQAHQELLETLKSVTDTDLEKPFAPYGESLGQTWLDILSANTYIHYDVHRAWIEEMLAKARSHAGTSESTRIT